MTTVAWVWTYYWKTIKTKHTKIFILLFPASICYSPEGTDGVCYLGVYHCQIMKQVRSASFGTMTPYVYV